MRAPAPLMIWALILAIGAGAAGRVSILDARRSSTAEAAPTRKLTIAEMFARARVAPASLGADAQRRLAQAAQLTFSSDPYATQSVARGVEAWRPKVVDLPAPPTHETIGPPDGAATVLRVAMQRPALRAAPRPATALAALEAAAPSARVGGGEVSAYGELEPDSFSSHRLTILQLGDSHTAADFFSGRVRERLQQAFGTGGDAYIVPGKPHIGVRSALFESDASDGWTYDALQKSDARNRFYLSGFNAVAHRAGASLSLRARGGRAYDRLEVAFLKQPGGGKAQVLLDGEPSGEIDLDGVADERAILDLKASSGADGQGFHEVAVKALSDAPVTVTDFDVGREGDGVSYLSVGFPGATVQLLQKLATDNVADDFRRLAPDVVVLAFGTNEGFNDNLDVAAYAAQYEQIVRRLTALRPGLRVVIIGPPDAARPTGSCHGAGVGQDCASNAQISAGAGGGQCKFPTPPKLGPVREAQRKLAQKLGAEFWDWSSVQPGPCGAQVWAAANPPLMAHDFVHMTLEGYKQSADRFADYLIPLIDGRQSRTHVVSNN